MKPDRFASPRWDALRAAVPLPCRAIPLPDLDLPTRVYTYAAREGLVTLGDLAERSAAELMATRGIGRLSMHQMARAVHAYLTALGETIEAREPAKVKVLVGWDAMRAALPLPCRAIPLRDIGLPVRVRNYAKQEGLVTLGDLAARSFAEMRSDSGVGKKSLNELMQAIRAHLAAAGEALPVPSPPERDADVEDERWARALSSLSAGRAEASRRLTDTGLLESWRTLISALPEERRTVIERRAGLGGRPETLSEIGAATGRSRERTRQIEEDALGRLAQEDGWLAEIRRRVSLALPEGEGAVPLDPIAADPWWHAIAALPFALDYLGERLLGGEARVVALRGRPHLSRCSERAIDDARDELRSRAEEMEVPAPLSAFEALVVPLRAQLGRVPAEVLFEELRELLRVEAVPGDEPRVIGIGTQVAAAFAILRASPAPMRIDELWTRVSGTPRRRFPEGMLRFGHNTVGLWHHIPDAAGWTARLGPPAIRLLEEAGAERQWTAGEIREALGEEVDVPAWLSDWHLTALLRATGELRYLGRQRFVLPDDSGEQARLHYHDELCRILRARGAPMSRGELAAELIRRTGVRESTISVCLTRPPILHCAPDLYGLCDRDLPGGAEALARAVDHIAAVLAEHGHALTGAQIQTAVASLSPTHARWTPEMCTSVPRGDARFRFAKGRGLASVGLASWPNEGPTRVEIIRRAVNDAGGRVRIAEVLSQIDAAFGAKPNRMRLWQMARNAGARLRGDWIEREPEGS